MQALLIVSRWSNCGQTANNHAVCFKKMYINEKIHCFWLPPMINVSKKKKKLKAKQAQTKCLILMPLIFRYSSKIPMMYINESNRANFSCLSHWLRYAEHWQRRTLSSIIVNYLPISVHCILFNFFFWTIVSIPLLLILHQKFSLSWKTKTLEIDIPFTHF